MRWLFFSLLCVSSVTAFAVSDAALYREIRALQQQSKNIERQLLRLEQQIQYKHALKYKTQAVPNKQQKAHGNRKPKMDAHKYVHPHRKQKTRATTPVRSGQNPAPTAIKPLSVYLPEKYHASSQFYPSVLVSNNHIITYIAGTPIVAAPYLGGRPAFDGSDYIVNVSSINTDARLMEQRKKIYQAFETLGAPTPELPIIALSGKLEPVVHYTKSFARDKNSDINLGATELDVAAILNPNVEGYIGIGYDDGPPDTGGLRVKNSAFSLNTGFINIGNRDYTPFYFTAGQMNVPFGRYSSSMVSAPLTAAMGKTKARPFLLGYNAYDPGFYVAAYAFRTSTDLGAQMDKGVNAGVRYQDTNALGEWGVSWIDALDESLGMQNTGAPAGFFGGFSSLMYGSEHIKKVPGIDVHGIFSVMRYNFTWEWLSATQAFRLADLSFNGLPAKPSAGQVEASVTFMSFDKPASFGLGYQWTEQALALNLPKKRYSAVFNISLWKNTIESLELRHEQDYSMSSFGNGAMPMGGTNLTLGGTGGTANSIVGQVGVYF